MIFSDFSKAVSQLGDPRFRRVLFLGLGLTLGLLFGMYFVFVELMQWVTPDTVTLPWIGEITWIDSAISGAGIILMMGLSVFLMVPVASAFTGLFLDEVSEAVEERYYPSLPKVPGVSIMDGLGDALGFLGVLVLANILALVLYILLPPFAPIIFWLLNGFLLGREYFQLVAMRRIGKAKAKVMRRKHIVEIWAAGALMAVPLTIPLVNLLIPVLGAATFTHLYHRLSQDARR